jgi:DMSO reductase anchor subunit
MALEEIPLVFFSVFTQMAIGLVLVSAVQQWSTAGGPTGNSLRFEWIAVLALLAMGVTASFFHLGHPLGAWRMLSNLSTAWLSREILMVGIFGVLVVLTLIGLYINKAGKWLITITAVAGLLALFAMAMTYAPPSMPAIDNYLPLVFFGLTALILGTAIASYFVPADKQHLLTIILGASLFAGLVVYLVAPSVWLSGDKVSAMTGELHLTSPLYWTHIIVGLLIPLIALIWTKRIPMWLPVLVLIGEFAGRIAFFALTVSSAANLGGMY